MITLEPPCHRLATDIVQTLLAQGADVNARDNKSGTALMAAKREGHKEIVHILKEAGAKE